MCSHSSPLGLVYARFDRAFHESTEAAQQHGQFPVGRVGVGVRRFGRLASAIPSFARALA